MVFPRIPAWLRPGPCQCPWFFLDFVTFSAGFLGFSKVFVRFTHAFHAFFEGFSRIFSGFSRKFCGCLGAPCCFWVPRFSKKNANPFAVLSSAYFGDAVTDHVSRGSVLFFGFPDFSKKKLTHLAACGLAPGGRRLQALAWLYRRYQPRFPSGAASCLHGICLPTCFNGCILSGTCMMIFDSWQIGARHFYIK